MTPALVVNTESVITVNSIVVERVRGECLFAALHYAYPSTTARLYHVNYVSRWSQRMSDGEGDLHL